MPEFALKDRRRSDLEAFFAPDSVAVVGAARERGKVGRVVLDNVVADFNGAVYPINPKAAEIEGRKTYASVGEIGRPIDLAVIAVPARAVEAVVDEAGRSGTRAAVVISAGFKESGIEGARLEADLLKTANRHGLRILGPNCLGVMDTGTGLNASFAGRLPERGGISFLSQSGALCTAILDWAQGEKVGFAKFISLGNKADVDEVDLFRVLAGDKQTTVIATYLEGVRDGRAFMAAAAEAAAEKPIVALKSGGTNAGARAVSSHTGSLAGSEKVYEAAFRQCGIIRAGSVEDLFDFALGFSSQPLPGGRRLAIVTNAGGPGIMAADASERAGLWLANFEDRTIQSLQRSLPAAAGVYNPVDVLGDALADRYGNAARTVLDDANVDAVIVVLTPQAMTEIKETAADLAAARSQNKRKPVFACFMGKERIDVGVKRLREAGIPNYAFPERAVAMVSAMVEYEQAKEKPVETAVKWPINLARVDEVIQNAGKRRNIIDAQALEIVEACGIAVPRTGLAHTAKDALSIAAEFHYPVVLKAASPDLLHKSDVGAIKVGVENDFALRRAYRDILENIDRYLPEAELWGVTVQEMVAGEMEAVLGMNRDSQFGPLLMFGLGGIYVEVLQDVSFRLAPLGLEDARLMVSEIKAFPLLQGVRGRETADTEAIINALLRLSQLVTSRPRIAEMDINPLIVKQAGQGVSAVDVRIILGEE